MFKYSVKQQLVEFSTNCKTQLIEMSHIKALVTLMHFQIIHFHIIVFSNRSTLDCIFKCLHFHVHLHSPYINKEVKVHLCNWGLEGLNPSYQYYNTISVIYLLRLSNKKVKSLTCFIYFSIYFYYSLHYSYILCITLAVGIVLVLYC